MNGWILARVKEEVRAVAVMVGFSLSEWDMYSQNEKCSFGLTYALSIKDTDFPPDIALHYKKDTPFRASLRLLLYNVFLPLEAALE